MRSRRVGHSEDDSECSRERDDSIENERISGGRAKGRAKGN